MFFAADAAQAREYILEACKGEQREAGGQRQVDDHRGNRAQQGAGGGRIEVMETDLGEYIVQLRNEPPSHIITPAIHLSKEDIGQLFADKLHMPYTAEPEELTAHRARPAARDVLGRRDGNHRRQLRDRRNRHAGGDRERRQRAAVEHACRKFSSP